MQKAAMPTELLSSACNGCWTGSTKEARQALAHEAQGRVPKGSNFLFLPSLPTLLFSSVDTLQKGSVEEYIICNFSFYSLYFTIISLGRLYFTIPLTLKFMICLAWATGKWSQVIINEFCAEILKGIANFCQVLLVFLSSAMRNTYPRKLLTAK